MPLVLTDADVRQYLTPLEAITVMEEVFRARAQGQTASTPRWELPFPEGRLTFTVGAVPGGVGFRAYLRGDFDHDDQVVLVWERNTGVLKGIVVGEALGILRTGAIGGVAIKYMTSPDTSTLALIGTGRQAMSQLTAIAAIRPLTSVRVYSRSPEHRAAFCQEAQALLPYLTIAPADSPQAAVQEAEIIVSATTSKTPVIQADWLLPGAHVSTLGTKGRTTREIDEALVERAAWIVTDSPEQTRNYPDGTVLDGTNQPLHELATVIYEQRPRPEGISLFLSSGLAGTEVALGAYLFEKYIASG